MSNQIIPLLPDSEEDLEIGRMVMANMSKVVHFLLKDTKSRRIDIPFQDLLSSSPPDNMMLIIMKEPHSFNISIRLLTPEEVGNLTEEASSYNSSLPSSKTPH